MFRSTRVFDRLGTGVPPAGTKVLMGKAVVLGGSMAGLLAARVLADHAESGVLLERDEFGAQSAARPGVPHGDEVHVLLPGGRVQLGRFYPGFTAQACAEGALLNEPEQQRVYQDGFEKPRGGPYRLLSGSRGLLEALVRRRTLELPNVKAVTCRAHDLVIRDGAATGVWCADSAGNWLEEADFVVDAMGRSSRLSEWLERSGWERPPMRRMKIDVNYATALFRRVPGVPEIGTSIAWRQPTGDPREVPVAATGAIEGNRWIVCVAGFGAYKAGPAFLRGTEGGRGRGLADVDVRGSRAAGRRRTISAWLPRFVVAARPECRGVESGRGNGGTLQFRDVHAAPSPAAHIAGHTRARIPRQPSPVEPRMSDWPGYLAGPKLPACLRPRVAVRDRRYLRNPRIPVFNSLTPATRRRPAVRRARPR